MTNYVKRVYYGVDQRFGSVPKKRGERRQYVRRVPQAYQFFDKRGTIRKALKTTSLEVARKRRDDLVLDLVKSAATFYGSWLYMKFLRHLDAALDNYEDSRLKWIYGKI